jgi:Kef-type K+ transport system membrane component KefB
MDEIHTLFVIGLVAVLAPLLARLPPLLQTPVVVLELVFGIAVGPGGLNWATSQGSIGFFGEFGLMFLFFQAGLKFKEDKIEAEALRLGAIAWLVSLGLSGVFVGFLTAMGLLRAPLLVALVLPTTAFGILLPILRQNGDLRSDFGRYVLGAAVIGEVGPMLLASVVLAHAHEHLRQTLLVMAFMLSAVGAVSLATNLRSERVSRMVAHWMGDTSILPVRIAILILLWLISLANELGMEIVLGAYMAGVVIAILAGETSGETLENRLTSIGSGFFIPLFFVTSGMEFDLPGLWANPGSLVRLLLFFMGFLLIRIIPACLYRKVLAQRDLLPLALFSSTTLPLVVAVTFLGTRTGHMLPENATALVGAAVLSVAIFPTLAILLRSRSDDARRDVAATVAVCRACDLVWAHFSRFIYFISPKAGRNS